MTCCGVASFGSIAEKASTSFSNIVDNVLRDLEDLSRHELVWLNTHLAGRLRALPPENVQQVHHLGELLLSLHLFAPF